MLKATDVSFSYDGGRRGARRVIDRVSFDVERGTIVGLLGPNGSGKTTLVRILAGMLHPDSGQVLLEGASVIDMSRRDLARRVALVPQETHTTFDFSVIDMVLMGRYPHLGPFELERPADLDIAREALEATGTADLESRSFRTLSGGEKQRVIIAAALAQASDLLLLDEPTTALDVGYQFEVAMLLKRLNTDHGTTMIVSTHDLNLAASLCERVVLLKSGSVIAHGPTAETLTAENIRLLYNVEADVQFHARAGHLTVVPLGRP
ncbi:MAG TPA: ABC transporter ATP-binding protein [Vicinamibacterales bacterium]